MYLRIQFTDSDIGQGVLQDFCGIPNGLCLSSSHAHAIISKEMRDIVGYSMVFWYLDVEVLNQRRGGVLACLQEIQSYPGVSRVDVLPLEGKYDDYMGKWEELDQLLMKYLHGVV